MIHFRHLLNLFFVFPMQYIVNENANDWIRTAELWCQKRPIYPLRHHHIPKRECFLTCLTVLLPPTAQFWHCTVLALHSFGTAKFWHCTVLALQMGQNKKLDMPTDSAMACLYWLFQEQSFKYT